MIISGFVKRFCLSITLLAGLSVAGLVHAADEGVRFEKSRFLPANPGVSHVSLVRKDDATANQFVLRVGFPVAVSGCAEFKSPSYSTNIKSPLMTINIGAPQLVNDTKAKYPHYECGGKQNTPHTDIYLNKVQILSNNITTIALQDPLYNTRKDFKVHITDDLVLLYPASEHDAYMQAFQEQDLQYKTDSMVHWYYPEHTYILYAPMADNNKDLKAEITALALSKNMKPLSDVMTNFKKPIITPNHYYFVAKRDLGITEDNRQVGSIKTTEKEYGLIKDETVETEIGVYAKKPGLYE